jgi:hypothetical protein
MLVLVLLEPIVETKAAGAEIDGTKAAPLPTSRARIEVAKLKFMMVVVG